MAVAFDHGHPAEKKQKHLVSDAAFAVATVLGVGAGGAYLERTTNVSGQAEVFLTGLFEPLNRSRAENTGGHSQTVPAERGAPYTFEQAEQGTQVTICRDRRGNRWRVEYYIDRNNPQANPLARAENEACGIPVDAQILLNSLLD